MRVVIYALMLSLLLVSAFKTTTFSAAQETLQVGTYLRYEVLHSFNLYFGQWTLKISGTDDYLVTNSFDSTIAVEETLWGVIGWPEETTLKEIHYLDENFTSKRNDSANTFEFKSSLLFEGSVLKKLGIDGVFEIVFRAANPSVGYEVSLNTPSAPGSRTCVFLIPMASVGENVSLAYGKFRIVSKEPSPEFDPRQCIIGVLNETADEGKTDYQAKWDVETGVLLELKYARTIYAGNGTETLLWKLKDTNLFHLVPSRDEPRRLELNETYVIDPVSANVNLTRQVAIYDIQDRDSVSFQIYQGYGPSNFTAFDSETGAMLQTELEYQLQYVIVRVFFPRTISNGQGYSFVLSNVYKSMAIVLGDWYQFATNYVSYGMPAYYTPTLVFPGDKVMKVEQSFVRKKLGSVMIDPHTYKTDNQTILSFETQYLTGGDEFNVVIDFRTFVFRVDITSIEFPPQILKGSNQTLKVSIQNKGDNCSLLVECEVSEDLWISGPQEVYLEEGKTRIAAFNFNPGKSGEAMIVVNAYKGSEKLESESVRFMVHFLSAKVETIHLPRTIDLDEPFNTTVSVRNDGTLASWFTVALLPQGDFLNVLNSNQTIYLDVAQATNISFSATAKGPGNNTVSAVLFAGQDRIHEMSQSILVYNISGPMRVWYILLWSLMNVGLVIGTLKLTSYRKFKGILSEILPDKDVVLGRIFLCLLVFSLLEYAVLCYFNPWFADAFHNIFGEVATVSMIATTVSIILAYLWTSRKKKPTD